MNSRRVPLVAMLLALCAVVAGCSGVPRSSRPEIIRAVGDNPSSTTSEIAPHPGDNPRSIVLDFLDAALSSDARHSGARQFLTTDAGGKWQDSTVTVLNAAPQVSPYAIDGDTATVTVTGQRVATIDSSGIYTPERETNGIGPVVPFTMTLRKVSGEWRISKLDNGILIRKADFENYYVARELYFFDATNSYLVPDIRYTSLKDQALADWLLTQLLAGPRPELASAVQTEVPDQVDPRRVNIAVKSPISVEIPGASQLDSPGLQRLAIQIAFTFDPVKYAAEFTLTDSGKPLTIPNVGAEFSTLSFPGFNIDNNSTASAPYFLRSGELVSGANDKPVPGPAGSGSYNLASVAVQEQPTGALLLAALTTKGTLLTGAATSALSQVTLPKGAQSRPDFQPGTTDVWLGVGGRIVRVTADHVAHLVQIPASLGGLPTGRIAALRFSPDGARIAVVVDSVDGTRAAWIGSVIRTDSAVSVADFTPVTPAGLAVSDVSWKNSTTLYLIASDSGAEAQVWTVWSDGSYLDTIATANLPRGLQGIASASEEPAIVTTDGPSVWVQSGSGWAALTGAEQTYGYAPVYSS